MSTTFLQFSVFFFRLLVGSYSQLYRDRKHPLFRILMGLQAFFILTQGNYTPTRKRRQNAFILEMTFCSLRHYAMQSPILLKVVFSTRQQHSSVVAQQRSSPLAYQLGSALVMQYTSLLVKQRGSMVAQQLVSSVAQQRCSALVTQRSSALAQQSSMLSFSQSRVGRTLSKNFCTLPQYTQSKSHPQKNFWLLLPFSLL